MTCPGIASCHSEARNLEGRTDRQDKYEFPTPFPRRIDTPNRQRTANTQIL